MSFKKITEEVSSRILFLHEQGKSQKYIALELGIGRHTVQRHVNPEFREKLVADKKRRSRERVHTILNGKRVHIRLERRPRPPSCELCGELVSRVQWHHWNDDHPELGIWVHPHCHYFVEAIEKGLGMEHVQKYLALKKKETSSH